MQIQLFQRVVPHPRSFNWFPEPRSTRDRQRRKKYLSNGCNEWLVPQKCEIRSVIYTREIFLNKMRCHERSIFAHLVISSNRDCDKICQFEKGKRRRPWALHLQKDRLCCVSNDLFVSSKIFRVIETPCTIVGLAAFPLQILSISLPFL